MWVPTVFNKNRDRLLNGDIAEKFFAQVLKQARASGLLSDEHFNVDGTLIQAWAAQDAAPGHHQSWLGCSPLRPPPTIWCGCGTLRWFPPHKFRGQVCSDDEKSPIRPHHPRVNAHDKTVGEKQEASPNNYFISLLACLKFYVLGLGSRWLSNNNS